MSICNLIKNFLPNDNILSVKKIETGNINETYLVTLLESHDKFILQKINKNVFSEPHKVMSNITKVTNHLKEKQKNVLKVIETSDGHSYFLDKNLEYWRCYKYIENTSSVNRTDDLETIFYTGKAFGEFHRLMLDFDATQLHVIIDDFHNTKKRFNDFEKAISDDLVDRVKLARNEIEYLLYNKKRAMILCDLREHNILPLRVTHNDTKCSNVLFDKSSKTSIAVIDLDTVMPGLLADDFGDGARSICSSTCEDDTDYENVKFCIDKFNYYCRGYFSETDRIMTAGERQTIHYGIYTITAELATRFLADYLNGDKYFKTTIKDHNLIRARNQISLLKSIENNFDKIQSIVYNFN